MPAWASSASTVAAWALSSWHAWSRWAFSSVHLSMFRPTKLIGLLPFESSCSRPCRLRQFGMAVDDEVAASGLEVHRAVAGEAHVPELGVHVLGTKGEP